MDWKDLGVIDVSDDIIGESGRTAAFKGMSRNQLVELFGYTDKRAKKFGQVNGRKLIRNIIYQQWLACQQEVREYKTIRQFWYSYVKPVISEAGLLDAKTDWDDVLSDELGTIVKDYKLFRYMDLYIRDKSRLRLIATGRHYQVNNMQKLIITGELPDLNKIIEASKQHWGKYNSFKKKYTHLAAIQARVQLNPVTIYPVAITIDWYCRSRQRDPDNISHAKKYVIDGLVKADILKSDGFKYIAEFQDRFFVDRSNPRVEITIQSADSDAVE